MIWTDLGITYALCALSGELVELNIKASITDVLKMTAFLFPLSVLIENSLPIQKWSFQYLIRGMLERNKPSSS